MDDRWGCRHRDQMACPLYRICCGDDCSRSSRLWAGCTCQWGENGVVETQWKSWADHVAKAVEEKQAATRRKRWIITAFPFFLVSSWSLCRWRLLSADFFVPSIFLSFHTPSSNSIHLRSQDSLVAVVMLHSALNFSPLKNIIKDILLLQSGWGRGWGQQMERCSIDWCYMQISMWSHDSVGGASAPFAFVSSMWAGAIPPKHQIQRRSGFKTCHRVNVNQAAPERLFLGARWGKLLRTGRMQTGKEDIPLQLIKELSSARACKCERGKWIQCQWEQLLRGEAVIFQGCKSISCRWLDGRFWITKWGGETESLEFLLQPNSDLLDGIIMSAAMYGFTSFCWDILLVTAGFSGMFCFLYSSYKNATFAYGF